ncbi:UDP-4-amino-4,6-dideoxy-N-acetyl-beta-L-altrosamine N-acetyltransferase [Robertmurraya sp. GLU-23]
MKWIRIKEEHLQQVLDWRTSKCVTQYMYTDIDYDLMKQKQWLDSINHDPKGLYWIMSYKDILIGYISITSIDEKHKRAYWNFYIGDLSYSMIAGFVGAYMYNYAFHTLGLEKLMGEVMGENTAVRKLHQLQGAREVGVFEKHIYKNGDWHDIYVYEMLKETWTEKGKKYHKYVPIIEK